MLLKHTHFPMPNGGPNWGAIVVTLVVVAGVSYMAYQIAKPKYISSSVKDTENEKQ